MEYSIDGISFEAELLPDMSFLSAYGRVFSVYATSVSGLLHFGTEGPFGRLYIRFAGAKTQNATCTPEAAVRRLERSVPLYARQHPALPVLLSHGPVSSGYALIFRWEEGQPLRTRPDGTQDTRSRFQYLSLETQLRMADSVFDLHAAYESEGLLPDGFSDAHVLTDPAAGRCTVCGVERYVPYPFRNTRGRMAGEADFLSPEEFDRDALITPRAGVYRMGRLAFSLFGKRFSTRREDWTAPPVLYDIAEKAARREQGERYENIASFLAAWRQALREIWIR